MPSDGKFSDLLVAMKKAAAVLRDHGIEFALAGGLAVYARGGPESEHDVDFVLRHDDADRALEMLEAAGFRSERPPEGWLYKVYDGESLIDLIFAPNNRPDAVDQILERADPLEVYAITFKVMSVTDVLATKLLALKEHEVDYESVLEVARACREQIDWDVLRERTGDYPFAKAFFTLAEELELCA
ncbi:MAG TPA: nucleotidyltransferase [Gaiellaceae bacterium]